MGMDSMYQTMQVAATGHIGKAIYHTGGPDTTALSNLAILTIKEILHSKAGTGRTDKIATSTVDAAAIVFLPHSTFGHLCGQIFRDLNCNLVFSDMSRDCS